MTPFLQSAHFQLTGRCNLSCRICGQAKGMLGAREHELPLEFWLRVAAEIKALSTAPLPEITLWGGEPLISDLFVPLAVKLGEMGFHLKIVTNGTLINRCPELLRKVIDTIYISIDGPEALHDAVRGDGVFRRLRSNLKLLEQRRGKLIFLTTISDANVRLLSELPDQLAPLGCDEIILQQLMYLAPAEIDRYRTISRKFLGYDYPELIAWQRSDDQEYLRILREQLELFHGRTYSVPVSFTSHSYPDRLNSTNYCDAPWHRIHVKYDGSVGFCTDYFNFTAGNLQAETVSEIFYGVKAETFRSLVASGLLPTCNHCPWKLQPFSTKN